MFKDTKKEEAQQYSLTRAGPSAGHLCFCCLIFEVFHCSLYFNGFIRLVTAILANALSGWPPLLFVLCCCGTDPCLTILRHTLLQLKASLLLAMPRIGEILQIGMNKTVVVLAPGTAEMCLRWAWKFVKTIEKDRVCVTNWPRFYCLWSMCAKSVSFNIGPFVLC